MNWKEAIHAIQNSREDWIKGNYLAFKAFFEESNVKPLGKLNEEALSAHYQNKIFKMYVGPEFNGLGLPLHEGAQWIENASMLDGNWGWLLGIGVGGAYFVDYMTEKAANEFFTPENALVAGSGMPNGNAKKKGDFWEISGVWNYCSGSEQASMFTAVVEKENQLKAIVYNPNQAEILPTWNTPGMRFTCSHTIKLDQAKINEHQFFDLTEPPRSSAYPLSKYPFMQFAQVCFAPVIAGISFSILNEAKKILQLKEKSWNARQPERVQVLHDKIELFFKDYDHLKTSFYDDVEKSWNQLMNNSAVNAEGVEQAALNWADECYNKVAEIIPYLGMTVLEKEHPIQLMWQNLQVGFQHSSLRKYP